MSTKEGPSGAENIPPAISHLDFESSEAIGEPAPYTEFGGRGPLSADDYYGAIDEVDGPLDTHANHPEHHPYLKGFVMAGGALALAGAGVWAAKKFLSRPSHNID